MCEAECPPRQVIAADTFLLGPHQPTAQAIRAPSGPAPAAVPAPGAFTGYTCRLSIRFTVSPPSPATPASPAPVTPESNSRNPRVQPPQPASGAPATGECLAGPHANPIFPASPSGTRRERWVPGDHHTACRPGTSRTGNDSRSYSEESPSSPAEKTKSTSCPGCPFTRNGAPALRPGTRSTVLRRVLRESRGARLHRPAPRIPRNHPACGRNRPRIHRHPRRRAGHRQQGERSPPRP